MILTMLSGTETGSDIFVSHFHLRKMNLVIRDDKSFRLSLTR